MVSIWPMYYNRDEAYYSSTCIAGGVVYNVLSQELDVALNKENKNEIKIFFSITIIFSPA